MKIKYLKFSYVLLITLKIEAIKWTAKVIIPD